MSEVVPAEDVGDQSAGSAGSTESAGTSASPVTRGHGWFFAVLGAVGLYGAFALALDKYKILEDPTFVPGCDLNPVLSCGTVMMTEQGSVFGFPNPLIGVIAFSVVVTVGVLVGSGVVLPRWTIGGLATGALLGVVFVHWLAFQSMYRIGALCPWCLVVWTVTLAIFVWSALLAARGVPALRRPAETIWSVRYAVLVLWYLGFFVAALIQFWYYWRTLL